MLLSLESYLTKSPRKIFLFDGIGAVLTASLIGIVLRHFQKYIGMPDQVLIALAIAACGFAVYSLSCFLINPDKPSTFIRIIAVANLLYCVISLVCVIYWFEDMTLLGIFYFVGEVIIVTVLSFIELKVERQAT